MTLSRSRKVWKASPGYSICHQWFSRDVMKRREYFLYGNKTKILTLFNIQKTVCILRPEDNLQNGITLTQRRRYMPKYRLYSTFRHVMCPLSQRSAIILWTQNAYSLLYQPRHREESSSSIYALILPQTAHLCDPADTEEYTHFESRG